MTIYETIKAAISVKQAAEHYGLKVSHNGMACCPFHIPFGSAASAAEPKGM